MCHVGRVFSQVASASNCRTKRAARSNASALISRSNAAHSLEFPSQHACNFSRRQAQSDPRLSAGEATAPRSHAVRWLSVSVSSFVGAPRPIDPDEVDVIPAGTEWPGIGVWIQVSDNGIGMTPLTLSRIFEPFFTTKATGSGTGLGLAVVHGILREHNAVLRVRSALEQGTVFTILLPGMSATDTLDAFVSEEAIEVTKSAAKTSCVPHILYVDDDESMAFLVKRFLDRNGYRVTTCIGPDEALTCLQSGRSLFTLCITDYNMPRMSGLALAKEIKARWPDLSVAIASGYISDELREQAPEAGVDELIYKPDTVEDLCRTIERLIERNTTD